MEWNRKKVRRKLIESGLMNRPLMVILVLITSILNLNLARALRFRKAGMKMFLIMMLLLVFSSSVFAQTVSHPAWQITVGTFSAGNFAFQDNLSVDTNTLHVDSTNNRVGIGTTGPDDKLDVEGSGNLGIRITNTGNTASDYSVFRLYQSGAEKGVIYTNQEDLYVRTPGGAGQDLLLQTIGGNVGIGTTNPGEKLEVAGNINATGGDICITGGNCLSNMGTGSGDVTGSGTVGKIPKWSGTKVLTDSVIYESGGNVGIGTTGPDTLLHLSPSSGTSELRVETTDTNDPTLSFKTTNTAHQIDLLLDESMVNDKLRIVGQTDLLNTCVSIDAKDGENAVLYFNSGSKFSYITHLADDRLQIANNNQDEDIFFQVDDGGVTKTITWDADVDKLKHSAGTFDFDNDNITTTGTITTTGNVGIGTTNPKAKLEVDGWINVTAGNDICIKGGNCLSEAGTGGGDITAVNIGTNQCLSGACDLTTLDGSGSGLDADLFDGRNSDDFIDDDGDTMSGNLNFNNYGIGIQGTYSATRYQGVFAMSDAYNLPANGTTPGNLYGIAWTHSNVGGQSKAGLGHQALFMTNGVTQTAIGTGIWTIGGITGTTIDTGYGAKEIKDTVGNCLSTDVHKGDGGCEAESSLSVGYATSAGSAATAGSATTATSLAADGSNCGAGSYARGIDANGNAQGCTADDNTDAIASCANVNDCTITAEDVACTGCVGSTDIGTIGACSNICTDANTDTQDLSYDAATNVISLTNGGSIDISEVDTHGTLEANDPVVSASITRSAYGSDWFDVTVNCPGAYPVRTGCSGFLNQAYGYRGVTPSGTNGCKAWAYHTTATAEVYVYAYCTKVV